MEFNSIQMSITALFLLGAVALVVVCNLVRSKIERGRKPGKLRTLKGPFPIPEKVIDARCEAIPMSSTAPGVVELAAATAAGAGDESYHAGAAPVQPSYNGQLPPITVDENVFQSLTSGLSRSAAATEGIHEPKHSPALVPSELEQKKAHPDSGSVETPLDVILGVDRVSTLAGMIDNLTMQRVLEINEPFSGVVVSIGLNDSGNGRGGERLEWIANYVASLLREKDFGCQIAREEFVIVCPGERGAEAQQRLKEIWEQLWNFRLRAAGTCSVRFSWGGVEAQNRPLADAVAAAAERMRQTRSHRYPINLDSVNVSRRIV